MRKYLAVIGTAGHHYNLLNYLSQHIILTEEVILVLCYLEEDVSTRTFYKKKILKNEWSCIYELKVGALKNVGWVNYNNQTKLLKKLVGVLRESNFEELIVGQYSSTYVKVICNAISTNRHVTLDEGNAVFKDIERRKYNSINSKLQMYYRLFGLNISEVNNLTYFTSYDIEVKEGDKVIKSNNSYSRKKFQTVEVNTHKSIIIGSPYVEDGILDTVYYRYLLDLMKQQNPKSSTVSYYPHRREEYENLEDIESSLGFIIINPTESIEEYFLNQVEIPGLVMSCYSAALLNLFNLTSNTKNKMSFISVRIKEDEIKKAPLKKVINDIYEEYDKMGLTIIGNE